MKNNVLILLATCSLLPVYVSAGDTGSDAHTQVSDKVAEQRGMLDKNTKGKGFGPQSPRDFDSSTGNNKRLFSTAPASTKMNLCNIHFHKNAEHKGGEFTKYAGNGDGNGYQSGYKYSGSLSTEELKPINKEACPSKHSVSG